VRDAAEKLSWKVLRISLSRTVQKNASNGRKNPRKRLLRRVKNKVQLYFQEDLSKRGAKYEVFAY